MMKGGEKMNKSEREILYKFPYTKGEIIKTSIKFVALRLIRQAYGLREKYGVDTLRDEILPTDRKYSIPFFFDSARRLVRNEKPLPYMEWVWWDKRRTARGDVDAHNSRRWKAQIEAMNRYFPELRPKK